MGSPPQVRGKRTEFATGAVRDRITPAGAGKTVFGTDRRAAAEDHPRRCGENGISVPSVKTITGSPPQVRGKHRQPCETVCRQGITPAGAGKTVEYGEVVEEGTDHPRRCGENVWTQLLLVWNRGSPPQVRGKPCKPVETHSLYRDHPRRCGENMSSHFCAPCQSGSPPRMRGKRRRTVSAFP